VSGDFIIVLTSCFGLSLWKFVAALVQLVYFGVFWLLTSLYGFVEDLDGAECFEVWLRLHLFAAACEGAVFNYSEQHLFDFDHSLVILWGHLLFLEPEFFVFVGLQVKSVHCVFKLLDSVLHFKFVFEMFCLVLVCSVVVLSTQLFVLLHLR